MLGGILEVYPNDEWHPCLKTMIFVLYIKYTFQEPQEICIYFKKHLKFFIHLLLMLNPPLLIRDKNGFLPLLVYNKNIENIITLLVPHLEHMFHFQYINLQGWFDHWHGDHPAEGNAHANFLLLCNFKCLSKTHMVLNLWWTCTFWII